MVEYDFFAENFAEEAIDAATWRKSHICPATTTARKLFLRLIIEKPRQNVSAMCRHFVAIPRKDLFVVALPKVLHIQLESDIFCAALSITFFVLNCICCH